jgi:hypothetical protein
METPVKLQLLKSEKAFGHDLDTIFVEITNAGAHCVPREEITYVFARARRPRGRAVGLCLFDRKCR